MKSPDVTIVEKLKPLSKQLVDSCTDLSSYLRFDKKHPQQLYSICTYGSILEIATAINALLETRQITGVPILLRTLLDAFASFRCCISDPNHFKAMYATFTREKHRLLRAASQNPDNPYLRELAEFIDVQEDMATLDKELDGLGKQGYQPMKPWQEFEKAGLEAEYQSLYWQLCMHAHNNVSALEDRHLDKKNGDYEVAYFKDENPKDTLRYLDSMCALVLDASNSIHGLLETGQASKLQDAARTLQEIRALYPKQ